MPELSRDDHHEIVRSATHPDWLTDSRRKVEVTLRFVPPEPDCECDWVWGLDDLGEKWTLARRDRECYLHGERGLF